MDSKEKERLYRYLPHRPPFLWVDRILAVDETGAETEKKIPADLDLFAGHYPGYPLLPGVLLCEAAFQTGAILISHTLSRAEEPAAGVPVVTRITSAKFKRQVRPGDTIRTAVSLKEILGPAWFLKGTVTVAGKVALQVEFGCTLTQTG